MIEAAGGPIPGGSRMSARVAGFVSHLRLNGMKLGPEETRGALQVLARGELAPVSEVRDTLKILLTGRKSEWERFDELFEAYWLSRGRARTRATDRASEGAASRTTARLWSDRSAGGPGAGAGSAEDPEAGSPAVADERSMPTASRRPSLRRTDLRQLADPDEMARAERIAFRIARSLRYRLSRRRHFVPSGSRLDLRRTIRRSLSRGGEPASLVFRDRLDRPVRLVAMLDTSGSMQPYTRYLVQFVRGLASSWADTDVYLFHTRLVRVTDVLRERDAMLAMTRLALMAQGIGGGTRLSESLETFNDDFAKRVLGSRSVFLMLSDGYDTGDPAHCVTQLARLKRRLRRLVWLNPMLGWESYEPVTRTMRAALPYIDHFAPAHTLDALAAIESELGAL